MLYTCVKDPIGKIPLLLVEEDFRLCYEQLRILLFCESEELIQLYPNKKLTKLIVFEFEGCRNLGNIQLDNLPGILLRATLLQNLPKQISI